MWRFDASLKKKRKSTYYEICISAYFSTTSYLMGSALDQLDNSYVLRCLTHWGVSVRYIKASSCSSAARQFISRRHVPRRDVYKLQLFADRGQLHASPLSFAKLLQMKEAKICFTATVLIAKPHIGLKKKNSLLLIRNNLSSSLICVTLPKSSKS